MKGSFAGSAKTLFWKSSALRLCSWNCLLLGRNLIQSIAEFHYAASRMHSFFAATVTSLGSLPLRIGDAGRDIGSHVCKIADGWLSRDAKDVFRAHFRKLV